MTEITKAHAEWAVVDRLRAMLNEPPHAEYNVTQAYGFCVAILAWVMQRVRTPGNPANSQQDLAAISVKAALEGQSMGELPWRLKASGPGSASGDFMGFTAFSFLKWLRDASCHGDARKVFPENKDGELIGFKFQMKSDGDQKVRSLVLMEHDLRRIGSALADMYCKALGESESFAVDAKSMQEKGAA